MMSRVTKSVRITLYTLKKAMNILYEAIGSDGQAVSFSAFFPPLDAFESVFSSFQQNLYIDRFQKIIVETGVTAFGQFEKGPVAGHGIKAGDGIFLSDELTELNTIHAGEFEVDEHDLDGVVFKQFKGALGAFSEYYAVASPGERCFKEFSNRLFIVNDKNFLFHRDVSFKKIQYVKNM